jgi:hypothetical protein
LSEQLWSARVAHFSLIKTSADSVPLADIQPNLDGDSGIIRGLPIFLISIAYNAH